MNHVVPEYEDFVFSHDPDFLASLDASDERLRNGEAGTISDLERELTDTVKLNHGDD